VAPRLGSSWRLLKANDAADVSGASLRNADMRKTIRTWRWVQVFPIRPRELYYASTRNLGIIWMQERSCAPARCWAALHHEYSLARVFT
jgi:hypothetical protein